MRILSTTFFYAFFFFLFVYIDAERKAAEEQVAVSAIEAMMGLGSGELI